jgi:DNA-binding MarR family transcriptional regulator
MTDRVDSALEAWSDERPDLDLSGAAVVNRIRRAATLIEERISALITQHGVRNPGDFDTMVALRRVGEPYELSPKQLGEQLLVTSAGLSGRLDRLEAAEMVARRPHPSDRRAVIVSLTPEAQELIDQVYAETLDLYEVALGSLDAEERRGLADLLRTVLLDLGDA